MSLRPRTVPAELLVSVLLVPVLLAGVTVGARTPRLRLVAAANVTVREKASEQSPAVAHLALGTEVSEAGDADLDQTWVHIVTADGEHGWVLASLTRPLDPFWKWQTQEEVIADRLARKGDGFPARVELVDFIERILDGFSDPVARARMDLHRLQAIQAAASAVPAGRQPREPYAAWLARYKDALVYSEASGTWLVSQDAIWKRHDHDANTPVADEIAWFAVSVGVAGECEGRLPCYFAWRDRLQGEYLRRYPAGGHAAEAVSEIGRTAILLGAPAAPGSGYLFDPRQDCGPLSASLDALERAVESATSAPERDATLTSLASIRRPCR